MPFVMVTWVPKAARQNPEVRKAVAKAVIQALAGVQAAEVTPDKVGAYAPPPRSLREVPPLAPVLGSNSAGGSPCALLRLSCASPRDRTISPCPRATRT